MELTRLPDVGPTYANLLRQGGIESIPQLAAATDLDALSQSTGIEPFRLDVFRASARAHLERVLEDAGVRGPHDLATADVADLSIRTGIPPEALQSYIVTARAQLGVPEPAPPAPLPEAPAPQEEPIVSDRVILRDRSARATVVLGGRFFENVAIVTARLDEDGPSLLERAPGDAVLLKERATHAPARIAGEARGELPIYKEAAGPDGVTTMTRVRIAEIRDRAPAKPREVQVPVQVEEPPKRKGLAALFRRK